MFVEREEGGRECGLLDYAEGVQVGEVIAEAHGGGALEEFDD